MQSLKTDNGQLTTAVRSTVIAIKIILPTAFIRHTEGQKQLSSNAENLPALIADIDQNFPALSTQIKDESGKLRRFVNVYVNDEDIRFLGGESYSFQDGDEVMLIPSIAGGR
jgi:molybdopterin synthase sulfur carrier subunit